MTKSRLSKGLTLIELLVGIGIAAVIVTLALSLFSSVAEENKISQEVKNIGTIVAGVKNMFASSSDYTGLTEEILMSTNVIPQNMRLNATDIKHSWARNAAAVGIGTASANTQFTVTFNSVPQEACVGMIMATVNNADRVTVGGNAVTTPANIVTQCQANSTATIVWTFL
jgi:prepilin-type N-terminal cleavage/methylation domain-containing protein